MAENFSFDIVSIVDLQEVKNAIQQATKEIGQRYDFKGSKSSIELQEKDKKIIVISDDEFKLKSVNEVMQGRMVKRNIPLKSLQYGKVEPAASGTARQEIVIQSGIDKERAKVLTKMIKDSGLKVQAQIQDEQIRVSSRSKDDLQSVMQLVRGKDLDFAVQFTNYR
jgi:hypothetical protein